MLQPRPHPESGSRNRAGLGNAAARAQEARVDSPAPTRSGIPHPRPQPGSRIPLRKPKAPGYQLSPDSTTLCARRRGRPHCCLEMQHFSL